MQMTYEQAMRPGMLLAFATRRGSGYMMRSEKRSGPRNGSNRRPPRRRAGFVYIFFTLLLCLILWPVGMVMLWRKKVRLQAGTKLLISLLTLCLSVFLIVFALTVPVDNPEFTAFQDKANDWLDQAAANVAKAGDAAYRKGTETWSIMSDFGEAASGYAMTHAADLVDGGVKLAGSARTAVEGLFHHDDAPQPTEAPAITDEPGDTDAPEAENTPEITEAPGTEAPAEEPAAETEAPDEGEAATDGIDIRLPRQTPDAQAALPLSDGTLHADGSFTPTEVSAPEGETPPEEEPAEPETWTALEDVTEAPTEEPTEEPTEAPTEAPTEEPVEEPAEAPTEEPVEEPAEAPTEEPVEEPAEEPAEAPEEAPAESADEQPAAQASEDPVMALVEPTPEADADAPDGEGEDPAGEAAEATGDAADGDGVMVLVEPTPEPVEEPAATPAPAVTVKAASEATVYYFENGNGFHAGPDRHNLNNTPAHTLAEAFAAGKSSCKSCGMPDESILSEEYVAWVDENNLIHTTDECRAFEGQWRLVPLDEAVSKDYAACADCGAIDWVESIFPTPTPTPEPQVVTPSTPLKSVGEITVYYFDVSRSYHAAKDCKGMSEAPAHTLAEAAADGKHRCGNCHPVSAELIGLPTLWLDEAGVCHTSDECGSFSGAYSLISRDDALEQALAACPDCGAAEYLIPGTVLAEN